jgi:aminoglycoside 6'-N-acetyltransferase I
MALTPAPLIRPATFGDRGEVARMATQLWPDDSTEEVAEFDRWLEEREPASEIAVAGRAGGGLCGFVWLAERRWAEGCPGGPVGYVEGWYVDADSRRHGVGRLLMDYAQQWCRSRGYEHLGSDAEMDNAISIAAHNALGFREAGRSVDFARPVSPP